MNGDAVSGLPTTAIVHVCPVRGTAQGSKDGFPRSHTPAVRYQRSGCTIEIRAVHIPSPVSCGVDRGCSAELAARRARLIRRCIQALRRAVLSAVLCMLCHGMSGIR